MPPQVPDDLSTLSDRALAELLDDAQAEERRVSDRRSKLQDRLDFLRSGGGAATTGAGSLFEKLTADEERVSEERKAIHVLIDRLHAERGRRLAR